MEESYCAQHSRDLGEGVWGTAVSHTTLWIALEVREPWGRKAFEQCAIGARPMNTLTQLGEAHPQLRIQLIRQPERRAGDPVLYVARTAFGGGRALWRVPITGYDDITSMNWEGWARGEVGWTAWREAAPVYLVCVHGRRDRCCAQRGMPVFSALREHAPRRVWQTSHLGGHRFAATLLTLPDGVCYGRVEPEEAGALFEAREADRMYDLARVRGRTALSSVAQAAECAIREHTGDHVLSDVRLEELSEDDEGVVHVQLVDTRGARHLAHLRRVEVGQAPASCGADPAPVYRYDVLGVTAV